MFCLSRWRPGMQLPNFKRCIDNSKLPPENATLETDIALLDAWLKPVQRLYTNSHLRGTCLLTGQQGTVDMTSNPKTSTLFFSSVNTIFMVQVGFSSFYM